MRSCSIRAGLTAALLVAATGAFAQEASPLWEQTRVGMSREAVASLYPAAVPDPDPANIIEATGARCLLRIEHHAVGEDHYIVNFCFVGDGLASLAMRSVPDERATRFAERGRRLVGRIRQLYGEAAQSGAVTPERTGMRFLKWRSGCVETLYLSVPAAADEGMLVANFDGSGCLAR